MRQSGQRLFQGIRTPEDGCFVVVNGKPLPPRNDLRNHSPDGFNWGYGGSGPAQLALAILAEALGDDDAAQEFYQRFKFEVIAGLKEDTWTITDTMVREWFERDAKRGSFLERN